MLSTLRVRRWTWGAGVSLLAFAILGTVSALWENPFFTRMTPAGSWEIGLLGAMSVLVGLYVAIRRPACSNRTVGAGGLLGFLGIACPVCNKLLLLAFGSELLLTYFEPIVGRNVRRGYLRGKTDWATAQLKWIAMAL